MGTHSKIDCVKQSKSLSHPTRMQSRVLENVKKGLKILGEKLKAGLAHGRSSVNSRCVNERAVMFHSPVDVSAGR